MTTGVGQHSWMRRVASMPSITGISMSITTTSGRRALVWAMASWPFVAVPTTS